MTALAVSFADPVWLLALLAIPLVVLLAVARSRRQDRFAMRFPAAATLAAAGGAEPAWRRWLPSALALAALAALLFGAARPQREVRVALQEASIMLVTDHSGSMAATDVAPNRLAAAQSAAKTFVDRLPDDVKVGVVAYSAAPDDVRPPSTDHGAARDAIARQTANGGTATGDALAAALGLLRPSNKARTPAAVVLLSDGTTTVGSDPEEVAAQAKKLGVPVYTVALGTEDATVPNPDPFGPPLPAVPDPETLRRVAQISGARAFSAQDAGQLGAIYKTLGSQLGSRAETRDATIVPILAGLALLLAAGGFALGRRT
jgi:Ca-activated chloride channel family protein